MKEIRARVTSKGQLTVPVEIRRLLKLSTPDNVAFIIDDGEVRLARRRSVVEETAGALRSERSALTAEEEREAIERAIAREADDRSL